MLKKEFRTNQFGRLIHRDVVIYTHKRLVKTQRAQVVSFKFASKYNNRESVMFDNMFLVTLVISIICGMVTNAIATNKGRSGAWFFVGLLFGPIGILVALIISKDSDELGRQGVETGDNRKCPFCAEIIKAEAKICRFCQKELSLRPEPIASSFDQTEEALRKNGYSLDKTPFGWIVFEPSGETVMFESEVSLLEYASNKGFKLA